MFETAHKKVPLKSIRRYRINELIGSSVNTRQCRKKFFALFPYMARTTIYKKMRATENDNAFSLGEEKIIARFFKVAHSEIFHK